MRARTTLAAAGLAAALASGAAAQGRPAVVERDPAPTFTSGVDMVTLNVSVRDRRGRIVRDLAAADFRLIDSGYGRRIENVFTSDAALSVAVLVDVSGSMALDGNVDRARRAVDAVAGALQRGRDEMALFAFDTALREVTSFTSELERVGMLELTEAPWGKTSLYDAIARRGDAGGPARPSAPGAARGDRRRGQRQPAHGGRGVRRGERHRRAGARSDGGPSPPPPRRRRRGGLARGPRALDRRQRARRADPRGICPRRWADCCPDCGTSTSSRSGPASAADGIPSRSGRLMIIW